MAIKMAKQQTDMQIHVSMDGATTMTYGKLIGYTPNALFVRHGNNLLILKCEGRSSLRSCGKQITIKTTDDIGLGRLRVFTYTEEVDSPQQQQ